MHTMNGGSVLVLVSMRRTQHTQHTWALLVDSHFLLVASLSLSFFFLFLPALPFLATGRVASVPLVCSLVCAT